MTRFLALLFIGLSVSDLAEGAEAASDRPDVLFIAVDDPLLD